MATPDELERWEEHDRQERRDLRQKVLAALEKLREVEQQLEDIELDLTAGEPEAHVGMSQAKKAK